MSESAWTGGQITTRARCILAPNPGPMTLDGTNTWVLMEPGSTEAIVVDPGPLHEDHLRRVCRVVTDAGARVVATLLTHGHHDHSDGAARFAELTGSTVRKAGPVSDALTDGEVIRAGDLELRVVATPGHTADSVCFALDADWALLTGDTVLGRGTTVVAHPDGELAAYLTSLDRIADLTRDAGVSTILPGHGPTLTDAAAAVDVYRDHRQQRLDQVRDALADGAAQESDPVEGVLTRVYADVPEIVWPAARMSIRAQLDYLGVR